jgi:hypothetical protein
MFQPKTIRTVSIVAICLCIVGLILSLLLIKYSLVGAVAGIVSWGLLTWAGIISYKLCSYKLYEEEYKKVGIVVYSIIAASLIFLFIGLVIGGIISVILLARVWSLKRNYDEWDHSVPAAPGIPLQNPESKL